MLKNLMFLTLSIHVACCFSADEIGLPFIDLHQNPGESRVAYLERVQPFLPSGNEFMKGTLEGEYIRYHKKDIEGERAVFRIKHQDITESEYVLSTLFELLLPSINRESSVKRMRLD